MTQERPGSGPATPQPNPTAVALDPHTAACCDAALGQWDLLQLHYGRRGRQTAEIRDSTGMRFVAKIHTERHRYHRELNAYRRWAPHLRPAAPELIAHDDDRLSLLITAVPGHSAAGSTPTAQTFTAAGHVLAALHRAPTEHAPAEAAAPRTDLVSQLEHWLAQGRRGTHRRPSHNP